ncbi:glutamyl-tRNA reductase [Flavobacteriaceae bacterium]|nr:glutamyl-tRNA reductase [Flavobacteriaceae bacterium]MDA9330176.1 glutamyl-tRNA reductase [bacterium]MDA9258023.1 glutamyl-tRNA reductase [Flavobacteriaceae bacterium]MDB4093004.1 glutamyl-tRNA reductase [Flavobacteriaceae bacterium]MDB9995157.1 glutamyl-tRNA reductase [Flavobacteriaceae bacterium]
MKASFFNVIGISYKNANTSVRGMFSLNLDQSKLLIQESLNEGIDNLIVNSTCNRVEIYSSSLDVNLLIKLLCKYSRGTTRDFKKYGYTIEGAEAINHIFKVGTGLDSQILGDFEIITQLNNSFLRSKKLQAINPSFERLFNMVKHASKRIKNETKISSGATSVSYAAVRYILDNIKDLKSKKILLFGTGKIGRNTCENLVKHTSNKHITLINRSEEKARLIAGKFEVLAKNISDLNDQISKTDILIVATSSNKPTVLKEMVSKSKSLTILDLSVPKNVEDELNSFKNIDLLDLDYLSTLTNKTLENRKKFIPNAEKIIKEITEDYYLWVETRKFAPTVNALKIKLKKIQENKINTLKKKTSSFDDTNVKEVSEHLIQKITNQIANHLRDSDDFEEELESIKTIFQLNHNDC